MRSPEQVNWHFVQDWLSKAEEDLQVAQELMARDRISYDPVGFHAQQAAEKFLKALLTRHQIPFPKTHSIRQLLELAEKAVPGIQESLSDARILSRYGVEIRYPGDRPPLNRLAAARAVELAIGIQTFVRERLQDYLRAGRPEIEP
jgi:HEPN domain-containing protein